jgi:hypothetical protein
VYRDLAACVYLSEALNPIPPFLTHCISYLCTYDLWALEIETFLGSVISIEPLGECHLGPKIEIPGPNPLPLAQVMDLHASYTLQGRINQCCGSMTFWGGSGSADPCLVLMDPDPDPALFVIDLPKMPTKN